MIADRIPASPSTHEARKALVDELHAARREYDRRPDAQNEIRVVRAELALERFDSEQGRAEQ